MTLNDTIPQSMYFTHIKPALSHLGSFTTRFTGIFIKTVEGLIVCHVLIAVGAAVNNDSLVIFGNLALGLVFISIYIQIYKGVNFFYYEIVKKKLFKNDIDDSSYFFLYLFAILLLPFSAKIAISISEFSIAIGLHIGYFVDGINTVLPSTPDTTP